MMVNCNASYNQSIAMAAQKTVPCLHQNVDVGKSLQQLKWQIIHGYPLLIEGLIFSLRF